MGEEEIEDELGVKRPVAGIVVDEDGVDLESFGEVRGEGVDDSLRKRVRVRLVV